MQNMEKIEYKFEKGFNMSSKIMEHILGIEAARLLSTLIYKHNYWSGEGRFVRLKEGNAFYTTLSDLQVETNMKPYTIGKAIKKLEESRLMIVKKTGLPAKNHYILNKKNISKFDSKYKDEYLAWSEKLRSKSSEDRDRFTEHSSKVRKEGTKLVAENHSESQLELQSREKSLTSKSVFNSQESELSNVTKNKITKNKITNNKKKKKEELTQVTIENDSNEFSDDELIRMFPHESADRKQIQEDDCDEDFDIYEDLDMLLKDVILEIKTPKDFFETVNSKYLIKEFNGFTLSVEDELLIYDCIINNPLFENDIEETREMICKFKQENDDISDSEVYDLIDFDDVFDQYDMVLEKLYWNIMKIKEGERIARFGNLFVGIKEMSNNYALAIP